MADDHRCMWCNERTDLPCPACLIELKEGATCQICVAACGCQAHKHCSRGGTMTYIDEEHDRWTRYPVDFTDGENLIVAEYEGWHALYYAKMVTTQALLNTPQYYAQFQK